MTLVLGWKIPFFFFLHEFPSPALCWVPLSLHLTKSRAMQHRKKHIQSTKLNRDMVESDYCSCTNNKPALAALTDRFSFPVKVPSRGQNRTETLALYTRPNQRASAWRWPFAHRASWYSVRTEQIIHPLSFLCFTPCTLEKS